LFPNKRVVIINVEVECETYHGILQQFRNNVALYSRSEIAHHIKAHQARKSLIPKLASAPDSLESSTYVPSPGAPLVWQAAPPLHVVSVTVILREPFRYTLIVEPMIEAVSTSPFLQ
jgi:hypothetical protein